MCTWKVTNSFSFLNVASGSGVPPSTRPQTCKRCKGCSYKLAYFGWRVHVVHVRELAKLYRSASYAKVQRIDNNETTKIYRSGGADPDGDNPGDLYVTIKIREDPLFYREGSDIYVNVILSITQFGCDGFGFDLWVDNNETIKVYRSGGANPDGDNPGDLYVTVREDHLFCREESDTHVISVEKDMIFM
ncbi:unnamed protein product [Sphenostylis stenocarpa]|uniref:Chaperone DnaJ C-terminal domain-containing protein n=1 Tax=Sphenostylis stenocarpa TaxID=92480 RepID=A0AA86SQZ9_9FABA|nr:unnamed protein product [Sphenostylis stenocarpa]